ncbi:MAG: carbamoyltransferase HypF [Bacteroidales bacterium]
MKIKNPAYYIKVSGLVQGVGFRPFIYRIAHENRVMGWVENNIRGVMIHAEGQPDQLDRFVADIRQKAPPAAHIDRISKTKVNAENFQDFSIRKSTDDVTGITEISPDIAVCDDCLSDMTAQPHRIAYPFTNCTNCGPRFTIIKDLPYDRDKTTMDVFKMCQVCRKEYSHVLDRRFHAQPVACNNCGPEYELIIGQVHIKGIDEILNRTTAMIDEGQIIAMKGMGGFHLMCDATNEEAVARLRSRKLREGKPFAVMFGHVEKIKEFTIMSDAEEEMLTSWRRPIVLLKSRKELAPSVNNGFRRTGIMLSYMPFHHQLFEKLKTPSVVLTSGNLSDEPIILDNRKAADTLTNIADATLIYNRDIFNRTDDSVGFVAGGKQSLIRRSRGFVPSPVRTQLNVDGIFAAGAELVNCFAMGKENLAMMSQHIGDLKNFETYAFYEETVDKFRHLFRVTPKIAAVDMHPDYFSTRFGKSMGMETVEIQHHHAHIASCMAEHGLDEKVIGISFDGTGLGDDGHIWGGEILVCDLEGYNRFTHFGYVPMPGGDKVTKEPWRSAVSYLYNTFGKDFYDLELDFLKSVPRYKTDMLLEAIDKRINSPLSSSCGRLFDAVSAMINLCPVSQFHAEAPMRLESIAQENINQSYPFYLGDTIGFDPAIREIVADLQQKVPQAMIAAKFHRTMINVIFASAEKVRQETGLNKVVLSGGSFQNILMLEGAVKKLTNHGFEVFVHEKVPANDGGIALGQLAIAAKRRK